ncbi:MAG: hypothetical protein ACLGGV_06190 [Bacteroidia bacterium]
MHVDITSQEILCCDSKSQYVIESKQLNGEQGDYLQVVAYSVKDKFSEKNLTEEEKIDVFVEAMSTLLREGKKVQIIYPS